MASDGANEEPYASEYAGKGSPNNSDNDEGTNVEHNASVTKLLTTQGIRDSNESTNADVENTVAMDTLKQLNTLLMQKEKRPLTQEERDQLAGLVERGLDILDLMSEGDAESAPPQETRRADGSSSACPLDMEDGNRKNSTGYGPRYAQPNRRRRDCGKSTPSKIHGRGGLRCHGLGCNKPRKLCARIGGVWRPYDIRF